MLPSANRTRIVTKSSIKASGTVVTVGSKNTHVSETVIDSSSPTPENTHPSLLHLYQLGLRDLRNIKSYRVCGAVGELTTVEVEYYVLPP